jgi:hypothetical protein
MNGLATQSHRVYGKGKNPSCQAKLLQIITN